MWRFGEKRLGNISISPDSFKDLVGGGKDGGKANVDQIHIREAEHQLAVEHDTLVEETVDEIDQRPVGRVEQSGHRASIRRSVSHAWSRETRSYTAATDP
jgi:hypothetical protein